MPNAFDDLPPGMPQVQAPPVVASGGNAFDDITPPIPERKAPAPQSMGDMVMGAVKRLPSQLGHATVDAVTALPLMVMDAGVAGRNLIEGRDKSGNYPYTLPSADVHAATDVAFGAPQSTGEKIGTAISSMLLSGGAASAKNLPATLRTLAAPMPESAAQVPSNFVNPQQAQAQQLAQALKKGQDAGLVVPPQTTNPNAFNAAVETVGGKIATAQGAAVHNAPQIDALAAKEVGLNPDAPLTVGALKQVRADAGKAYQAVRKVGKISTDDQYLQSLTSVAQQAAGPATSFPGTKASPLISEVDSLLQPSFDASHAIDKVGQLRDAASMAFRAGDAGTGTGYKTLSNALETQIDRNLSARVAAGDKSVSPGMVSNWQNSRQLIAKTHSIEDALNETTGHVSAQALANSGDPLSGNLKTIADFARIAPKAVQDTSKIGSHGVSHLDMMGTMLTSALGEHVGGPWGMLAGAAYPVARTGARSFALGPGQSGAIPSAAALYAGPKNAQAAALMQALKQAGP
jgi:hypothetical protein